MFIEGERIRFIAKLWKEKEINVMIREKMLDQVKEEHPRIAGYVRIF